MRKRHQPRRQQPPLSLNLPVKRYTVTGLTHEAKGVARLEGKVAFIDGALPGEVVDAQLTKVHKSYDQAELTTLIEPSAERITPPCPHYQQCGGCSFQHMSEHQQLDAKQQWLRGQLRKVLAAERPLDILNDQAYGYRRRARISVYVKDGRVLLGFRAKGSKHITPIDNCLVLSSPLQRLYQALKQQLLADPLAADIGHVELLDDDAGLSVLLRVIKPLAAASESRWQDWAAQQGCQLYWQHANEARAAVADADRRYYQVEGLRLSYHPQDFIQVNSAMNDKMVAQALNWLKLNAQDVVLDLFCGVGNFTVPLAKQAKQVIGVEVQESMVQAGRDNARANGLSNVSFIAADLTQPLQAELDQLGVTKVLLDPPRAGAYEFLANIVKLNPQQILYVSCDAATLARDAEFLVEQGFEVIRVTMMNMFPQTSHVETMMLLSRKAN